MAADARLEELRADAVRRAPALPGLDTLVEDAGRQRLAAYYLYAALLAGVIGEDDLGRGRWPAQLAEPMTRLGLTRFAPRSGRGLDAQLNPDEQAIWRRPGRQLEFAQLVADLVNQGALGSLCGGADQVRLAGQGARRGLDLELIKDGRVVGTCRAEDHWELVARHLAGVPHGGDTAADEPPAPKASTRSRNSGVTRAVSLGVTLAVTAHPLGAVADAGAWLIHSRIQAGRDQADALGRLGQQLHSLRAQADADLADLRAGRST
jgi:hypothetical protein